MKSFLFVLTFCFACSLHSSAQKMTYKDLLGEWDVDTTNNASGMWLKFNDSTHVMFSFGEVSNFIYSIDTSGALPLLHLVGDSKKVKANIFWFVKMPDNNTLQLQGNFKGVKPKSWDTAETPANTGVLIRKK